jgi:hypothetical protein
VPRAARLSVWRACEHTFVPRYTEEQARAAVATSFCYSEALQKLGLRPAGGNHSLFRRYVDEIWRIPTDHFDDLVARRAVRPACRPIPLEDVLIDGSRYSRRSLKRRLFDADLKDRWCELCGQGEIWRGKRMGLILDHINGVPDDNRLTNLRIVCPNCAATFDTHCARKNRSSPRDCARCGKSFVPRRRNQTYCSRECGTRHDKRGQLYPERRKVPRPSYAELKADLAEMSFLAVGRKYGVSGNAVRKWLRLYEREAGGKAEA